MEVVRFATDPVRGKPDFSAVPLCRNSFEAELADGSRDVVLEVVIMRLGGASIDDRGGLSFGSVLLLDWLLNRLTAPFIF